MKHRILIALAITGVLAALGAVMPAQAGELAGAWQFLQLGGDGLGLAAVGLALGNVDVVDLKKLAEKQLETFEQFKTANDARLGEIEKKGHESAETRQIVNRINTELTTIAAQIKTMFERADDMEKKMNRPRAGGAEGDTPEVAEHKARLSAYLRTGEKAGLAEAERKAMTMQSDPDGGFLVSAEMDSSIDRIASAVTTFRSIANVRTIGKSSYKKMVKTRGVAGGWVGESEDSTETTGPQFAEIEIQAVRMYAEPWVPNDLLEDSDYDLEMDLADEAGITFRETEGTAFINGTGVKQARGFLSYPTVANASYAWGKLGFISTGVSGDFAASNKADKVIDLQHSLKQVYRPGAVFLCNDATLAIMREFKDSSGSYYLWNPDPSRGPSGTFLGSPVVVDDYMPAMAANSFSLAFGNFKRGYTIVDRRGTALIRDNVTKKGFTKFHFSRRVGGGVTHYEAIKLLKFA